MVAGTLSLILAACGSSATITPLPAGAEPPAACARPDDGGVLAISTDNLLFSAPCMVSLAGEAFTIHYTNLESEPHNVSIFSDPAKSSNLFLGDVITGPDAEIDYEIEGLDQGLRFFECTIHPAMNGPLFVVESPSS